jgi:hypothetical protein
MEEMRKVFKIKNILLLSTAMVFTAAAFAQDTNRWEVYGDYAYMQFNPTLSGLQSRAFNGGGGGAQVNFGHYFGIKGDFQGFGSTQWTLTETAPVVTPHGTIPAGTYKSNFTAFTYLFGPVVGVHYHRFYVFGNYLMGQTAANGYGQLVKAINAGGGTVNGSSSQHPFTQALGGGLDLNVNKMLAFRLGEMDWVLTRATNPLTSTNNQNSFRYLGGVVLRFGAQ